MVLSRLFGGRKTGKWIAGVHVDPPEVSYAWFDADDPQNTVMSGVAVSLDAAVQALDAWQQETNQQVLAVGVNERLWGRVASPPADVAASPPELVAKRLAVGPDVQVVTVATAPWCLHALEIGGGPKAGAVIDRTNVAVALREDGATWVAGDWSDAYGRTGSIGGVVLRSANLLAEMQDARTQVSSLRTALPTAVDRPDPEAFFEWVDREAHTDVAGCLKILDTVHATSRSGDVMADRLVNLIAADIGRNIVASIEQTSLQGKRLQVLIAGRVIERIPGLRTGILRRVELVNESVHVEMVPLVHPGIALARAVHGSGVLRRR